MTVAGSEQSQVLSGLDRWTQYKIWVAAVTSAGEGPLSDVIVVQTDEDGTCGTIRVTLVTLLTCCTFFLRTVRVLLCSLFLLLCNK